jgi:2'-5' RNA ligase
MPRRRVAIALLVPEPAATEIDGLRRALADTARATVVPHITLVSPINVHADDLPLVVDEMKAAAATVRPFTVTLGPPVTFHPVTPVVYLAVDNVEPINALHDALGAGVLERDDAYPFVPHVTIASEMELDRIPFSLQALANFQIDVTFNAVDLLEDRAPGPKRWNSIATIRLT